MRTKIRNIHAMARHDRGLSVFLVFLLSWVFVITPLADLSQVSNVVTESCLAVLVGAGVVAMAVNRTATLLAAIFAGVALFVRWGEILVPNGVPGRWDTALALGFFVWLTLAIALHTLRPGRVTVHRLQGAIAVYLLIALVWAFAYELLLQFSPGAIRLDSLPNDDDALIAKLMYFSLSTLTTVGYGDITPIHPLARSMAMLEGLIGQLFPAVLLARLVGLELETRRGS